MSYDQTITADDADDGNDDDGGDDEYDINDDDNDDAAPGVCHFRRGQALLEEFHKWRASKYPGSTLLPSHKKEKKGQQNCMIW